MRLILTIGFSIAILLANSTVCFAENPYLIVLTDVGQRVQVPLYEHITPENIEKIFRYPLVSEGQYGAKVVVASLFGQAPTIYFYGIGDETHYYGAKHFRALEVAMAEQYRLNEQETHARSLPMSYRESLKYSQGFQLQAAKVDGQLKVVGFDIDSSIVSDQIEYRIPLSKHLQRSMLAATIKAISPGLIVFKKPIWHSRMNWDCESSLQKKQF